MTLANEKRYLQMAVALACIVPLFGGTAGLIAGASILGGSGGIDLDSHVRYLSGLLLGVGLAFAAAIPGIEKHTARVRLLTFLVAIGGLSRLLGFVNVGLPGHGMEAALVMELIVTPSLCLWQNSLARRWGEQALVKFHDLDLGAIKHQS